MGTYLGAGHFTVAKKKEVHQRKSTNISLLFANQTEDDILCRNLLEDVEKSYPGRVQLWYTLDKPSEGWKYSKGFINDTMIKEHLPPPSSSTHIFLFGPPVMIERACLPNLQKLGYKDDNIFAF